MALEDCTRLVDVRARVDREGLATPSARRFGGLAPGSPRKRLGVGLTSLIMRIRQFSGIDLRGPEARFDGGRDNLSLI